MRRLPSGKPICWVLCLAAMQLPVYAEEREVPDTAAANSQEEAPDRELLAFLAEFGAADEDTFEVIMYQGVEDAAMPEEQVEKRVSHE